MGSVILLGVALLTITILSLAIIFYQNLTLCILRFFISLFLTPKSKISFAAGSNNRTALPKKPPFSFFPPKCNYLFKYEVSLCCSFFKNCVFCCYNSSIFSSECLYFWICPTLYRSRVGHFLKEYTNICPGNIQSLSVPFSLLLLVSVL